MAEPTTRASDDFDAAVDRIRDQNDKIKKAALKVQSAAGGNPGKNLQAAIDELIALVDEAPGRASGVPERRAPQKSQ